jgi:hypothetical protein
VLIKFPGRVALHLKSGGSLGLTFEKLWLRHGHYIEGIRVLWIIGMIKQNNFRRIARGWSSNLEADIIKQKKKLMEEYDALDIVSETHPLFDAGRNKLDIILR